jgi:hypothetical protein
MLFIIVLNQFNKKVKKIGAARVRTRLARVNRTERGSKPLRYNSDLVNCRCREPFDLNLKRQWRTPRGALLLSLVVAHP